MSAAELRKVYPKSLSKVCTADYLREISSFLPSNMEFEAPDGSIFNLPEITRQDLEDLSPSEFFGTLLEHNMLLFWSSFNRSNIVELIDYLVIKFRLAHSKNAQLLKPFESSVTVVSVNPLYFTTLANVCLVRSSHDNGKRSKQYCRFPYQLCFPSELSDRCRTNST